MRSRRNFLTGSVGAVAGALAASNSWAGTPPSQPCITEVASLCGEWFFCTDPDNRGTKSNWHRDSVPGEGWRKVTVPHTWQIETGLADYRGIAWYRRPFDLPGSDLRASQQERAVRVEFEAVFHSATIWGQRPARRGTRAQRLHCLHIRHHEPGTVGSHERDRSPRG
jgi:hypothetical protein